MASITNAATARRIRIRTDARRSGTMPAFYENTSRTHRRALRISVLNDKRYEDFFCQPPMIAPATIKPNNGHPASISISRGWRSSNE
jgi:hypothetical protein